MLSLLYMIMAASVHAVNTSLTYNELFTEAYRVTTTVPVGMFRQQTNLTAVGVSYMGWAQIPSTSSSPNRLVFHIHPNLDPSMALPKLFVAKSRFLALNVTTTAGQETLIGPNVTSDTWFSFGVAIQNGPGRHVTFYVSYRVGIGQRVTPQYDTKSVALRGDMRTSPSAMATVGAVTLTTDSVAVYLIQLRVFASALDAASFDLFRFNFPPPFYYAIGAQVGGIAFERSSAERNLSCPDGLVVASVDDAFYGRPRGLFPNIAASPTCDLGPSAITVVQRACLGKRSCAVPRTNVQYGADPCVGSSKWVAVAFSCALPTTNAWRLSLTIAAVVNDAIAFVNETSAALKRPPTRFKNVEFAQRTASSTLVAFVIVADPRTDPDGLLLVVDFCEQMQIAGNRLRSGTVLAAVTDPVSIVIQSVFV